jgi:hypothetical protein
MSCAYSLPSNVSEQFRWVCWDADVLLYNIRTGDTHMALSPAGYVIDLLSTDLSGVTVSDIQIANLLAERTSTLTRDTQASIAALCSVGFLKQTPLADC